MKRKKGESSSDCLSLREQRIYVAVCQAITDLETPKEGTPKKATLGEISSKVCDAGHGTGTDASGLWHKIAHVNEHSLKHARKKALVSTPKGGWAITETGRFLWRLWEKQIKEEDAACELLRQKARAEEGRTRTIVVAAADTVRSYLLPHIAEYLRREKGDLEIEIVDFDGPSTIYQAGAGGVDAVMAWDVPGDVGGKLEVTPLSGTEFPLRVMFRPGHPLSTPRDMKGVPQKLSEEAIRSYPVVYPDILRWTPLSRPKSGDPSLLFRQAVLAPTPYTSAGVR